MESAMRSRKGINIYISEQYLERMSRAKYSLDLTKERSKHQNPESQNMKETGNINTACISPKFCCYDTNKREELRWIPVFERSCSFRPQIFLEAMQEMVLNPNYSTSWILRADILLDSRSPDNDITGKLASCSLDEGERSYVLAQDIEMRGFLPTRTIVRKFVPRNPQRDKAANQTCLFFQENIRYETSMGKTLVVYLAHASSVEELPYYLPAARAVAFLYEECLPDGLESSGRISVHYLLFSTPNGGTPTLTTRLERTALRLMERIIKVGNGNVHGYEKRVHHDLIVPRERSQDTYLKLRVRHAKRLMDAWVEKTDPKKHVFEDILIAAFLIELWGDMYRKIEVPGFVDIGCGNGVLVDILLREGYKGYGFDARKRMTWAIFDKETQKCLSEKVLIPWMLEGEMVKAGCFVEAEGTGETKVSTEEGLQSEGGTIPGIHDGRFREGTFIISNHADELTGWTPLLAKASNSPFLIIPCCSHDLSGNKHRHKSVMAKTTTGTSITSVGKTARVGTVSSEYASLVEWTASIAEDVGYVVEREVMRIPSTRNIGLIGRKCEDGELDLDEVLAREGGGVGWTDKAFALRKVQLQKGHG